jgi:CIC family chloride channel protein
MSIVRPFISRPTALTHSLTEHFRIARHVFLVAAPIGILVGASIAGYDYLVNAWLWDRFAHHLSPIVLCLLPIAGLLGTGVILTLFRVPSSSMADEVVLAYHRPQAGIDYRSAIPKLTASIATMGLGGSAGMEGASKWLGATISSYVQWRLNAVARLARLHGRVETTMLAGAAAGIAAIFRAPLTGAIMGIESPYKHDLAHESLIHALVASAASYATFSYLRPATPYFPITFAYHLHVRDLLLCLPLGLLGGLGSHAFLALLSRIKRAWKRWGAPTLVKYAAGGVLVSAIAIASMFIVGTPVTLQAGLPVANGLLNGQFALRACIAILLAKTLATALTFGCGGVGGLFVPSATIGAALGAICDLLWHPSQPGLFTLVGIAAFTGASYNSLLFAAVFVAEATGSPALVVPGLLASSTAFLVSAGISNSDSQRQRRQSDEAMLGRMLCSDWMTTRIVIAAPDERLTVFMERAVLEHPFRALPVIDPELGVFVGIAELKAIKTVPREQWPLATVARIIDRAARTVCPDASMATAELLLAQGPHDYLPVVDPTTDQLIGILSSTDILRARHEAHARIDQEVRGTSAANVAVMHSSERRAAGAPGKDRLVL